MVAHAPIAVHDAQMAMLRIAWRVLALLVVAVVYLIVALEVVWSTKPLFEPEAFSRAEKAAIREAAGRGDESICGMGIPEEFRGSLASGTASIGYLHTDVVAVAECLYDHGYLDDAGFAASLAYGEERTWRWWEKALFVLGFVAVVGFTGFLILRRSHRQARA